MSAIFPPWVNRLPFLGLIIVVPGALVLIGCVWYYLSPRYYEVGYAPVQPVAYSHKQHAGDFGMDCRYCHTSVEVSPHANVPPTQVCMNCHTAVATERPTLQLVRQSAAEGTPIPWVRIHKMPDYVHFDHSAHVSAGVGCVSCHGRVDQMAVVRQVEPLSMSWCLECHRDPAPHIRPKDKVTVMDYVPASADEGRQLVEHYRINPPENCSACHY